MDSRNAHYGDPITDEPEIMAAALGPASAAGDADAAWFWLNMDQTLRVRKATPNERNLDKNITITIVRSQEPGMRIREFLMVPEDHVAYVLKTSERCLVDDGSAILIPGSNVNGEILAWPEDESI